MSSRSRKVITRKQRGNWIIMDVVFLTLFAAILTIACSFGSTFFIYNRLQASANEVALAGARKLNEHDSIGQINNMIGRCRQLAYSSTKKYDDVMAHYPQLETLAQELRDEAQSSANELETQRI